MRVLNVKSVVAPSFKGIREDKDNVSQLSKGNLPILPPKKRNILASLNNLAQTPSDDNLEFLLGTAENVKYGLKKNSQFANILDEKTNIPQEKENTKWNELLENAIKNALESTDSPRKSEFQEKYKKIFIDEKPLSNDEKKMLELRSAVLSSKEMSNAIEDSDKLIHSAKIAENLDYFIASSEIPQEQKLECLKKMQVFLSPQYKINEQLKDKKLQVLDEMLNDMVIETPAQKPLLIKQVNQRQTGMCAAISVCRKQLAYEDKSTYMDVLMKELDDKPTMEVYDVTKLKQQAKVDAKKTYVDFNDAISKGYRIIDASAHQWMHVAGTRGDGTTNAKTYTPFDKDNYEVFRDSRWYADLPDKYQPQQNFLRHLIKENEAIESIEKRQKSINKIKREIGDYKTQYLIDVEKGTNKLDEYIAKIAPQASNAERSGAIRELLKLEKADDTEIKIHPTDSPDFKKEKIYKFLSKKFTNAHAVVIKSQIDNIYSMYSLVNASNEKLDKLKKYNEPKSKYQYNNNLFKLAATNRTSVEAELKIPNKIGEYENDLDIPMPEQYTANYIATLYSKLDSQKVVNELAQKLGIEPSKDIVQNTLNSLSKNVEVFIPLKLDSVLNKISMGNRATVLNSMLSEIEQTVNSGDKESIEKFAKNAKIKDTKAIVSNKISEYKEILVNNPTNKQLSEITRAIGYDSEITMIADMYNNFITALSQPISQEAYSSIMQNLGNPPSIGPAINKVAQDINSVANYFDQIQAVLDIPTRPEVIMKTLEKSGFVLSKRELDILENKFNEVQKARLEREKRQQNGEKIKPDNSLYEFSTEEQEILKKIEKAYSATKKYSKSNYNMMNDYLAPQLDKLYGETGRISGNFWLPEEGDSGLPRNESVRITEQMTGKPYYVEANALTIAKKVKEGNGSGTSSTSVMHTEPAMHAQYVADVSSIEMLDQRSKQKVIKEVLWHDNSWGPAEGEDKWLAEDGTYHTDYGSGYGGEKGYIFGDDFKTGTLVSDLITKTCKYESDGEQIEFPMFNNTVLPGLDPTGSQKIAELYSYIFKIGSEKATLDNFEKSIAQAGNINVKALEHLDEEASMMLDSFTKRVKDIKTKQQYDNIPDSDTLKLLIEKTALLLSVKDIETKDEVLGLETIDEVRSFKKNLLNTYRNNIAGLFFKTDDSFEALAKSFSEQIADSIKETNLIDEKEANSLAVDIFDVNTNQYDGSLNSLKSLLANNVSEIVSKNTTNPKDAKILEKAINTTLNSLINENIEINNINDFTLQTGHFGQFVLSFIDKKYAPNNDKEVLDILKRYQNMSKKDFANELSSLKAADFGIESKQPFDIVRNLNAKQELAEKNFTDVINTYVIYRGIVEQAKNNKNTSSNIEDIITTSPQVRYRNLYINMSELDTEKYIKKFKNQAFDKYKIRPAFPQLHIFNTEELKQNLDINIKQLETFANDVASNKYLSCLLSKTNSLIEAVETTNDFTEKDSFNKIKDAIKEIYPLIQEDSSLEQFKEDIAQIDTDLSEKPTTADNQKIKADIQPIIDFVNEMKKNGVDEDSLKLANSEYLRQVKNFMNIFVKAHIQPKYQNDMTRNLNKWFKAYTENSDSEKTIELENELGDLFIDKHITNSPMDLIHSYVETVQSPNADPNVKAVLREFMEEAQKAAMLTKVEYKLVKNENAGIASKSADFMELIKLKGNDNKDYALTSDVGLSFLIDKLANPSNDYSTMKLFLTQTGMNEKALDILTSNINKKAVKKYLDSLETSIISGFNFAQNINNTFADFAQNNEIKYPTYYDGINHLLTTIENNQSKKTTPVEKKLLDAYKKMMIDSTNSQISKTIQPEAVLPNIAQMHIAVLQELEKSSQTNLNNLNQYYQALQEQRKMVSAINVPDNSKMNKKKAQFDNELLGIIEMQQEVVNRINEFLNAQNKD